MAFLFGTLLGRLGTILEENFKREVNFIMELIKNYEIGKEAHYREIEAEFERQWREQISKANVRNLPLIDRLIWGLGSITIGILMIVQALAS